MNFSDALIAMMDGHKIRRKDWIENEVTYSYLAIAGEPEDCDIKHYDTGPGIVGSHDWHPYSKDLLADDWMIVE